VPEEQPQACRLVAVAHSTLHLPAVFDLLSRSAGKQQDLLGLFCWLGLLSTQQHLPVRLPRGSSPLLSTAVHGLLVLESMPS